MTARRWAILTLEANAIEWRDRPTQEVFDLAFYLEALDKLGPGRRAIPSHLIVADEVTPLGDREQTPDDVLRFWIR